MDAVVIFCAKYLIILPPVSLVVYVLLAQNVRRKLVLLAGLALPVAYGLGKFADFLYYNARPFVDQGTAPLVAHVADNGFPSNHMLLAATVASIIFVYNRSLGVGLWVVALLIGLARVMADVHHLLDIGASGAIAVVAVGGVYMSIRTAAWYSAVRKI